MIPKKRCANCGQGSLEALKVEFGFKNVEVRRPSIDYPYHCPVCGMGADTKEKAIACCEKLRVQKWG
ncbi:MAG: hypothetical protein ACTSRC_21900 [Candidatus Helarchaeota archaeon]